MRKKLDIIIFLSVVIIGIIIISYNKNIKNNYEVKEIRQLQINELKDNKNLAIMVQENGSEEYKPMGSRDAWPEYPKYIYMKAECDDGNGAKLVGTDVINYEEQTNKLTMITKTTLYCTLYFAKTSDAYTLVAEKGGATFKKAFEEYTMHRFIGTYQEVKNNYICFGTTNQVDCTGNPDKYMYRVIGITDLADEQVGLQKGQLKIIKATPNEDGSQKWHSSKSNITWDEAIIQTTYLNDTFLSSITGSIGTKKWTEIISSPKWYIGDNTKANSTNVEVTSATSQNHQIGLMYASDYYNSWSYGSNTNSWLNICHGRTNTSIKCGSQTEWTMSRYGSGNAWKVSTDGSLVYYYGMSDTARVRPVFYLTPDIKLSGEGSEDNPFIIG